MARDYYDESKPKKKKEEKKVAVQKQPSSSVSKQAKQNQKSYGTTNPVLKQKTTTTTKQNTQNKTVSKPITQQQRQNQKSYGNTNGQQTRRTTTTRQQTTPKTQISTSQRRKNAETNNNLKQTIAQQNRNKAASTAGEMLERRMAAQKTTSEAYQLPEGARRAVKNTPSLVKKAAIDTGSGYLQTLEDVSERIAKNENVTHAKAMKMGIEEGTKQYKQLEEERKKTAEEARKEREKLFAEQEKRQQEWDEKAKDAKGLEKAYYGAVESGTGMLIDAGVGAITGTGQVGSLASMGLRTYGSAANQARKEGATDEEAGWYGLLQSGKEIGTELMFPGAGLAKKAYGRAGAGLGERAANILLKNLKGSSANMASSGVRLLGGVLEENAEEGAGWLLDPLIKEYTYGKNVRNRNMESAKASMRESSEALKANIENEDDVRAAAAYLSSGDFLEQTRQSYIEAGLSEDDAAEIAEKMRDYLSASISGDTDTMIELEDEISKRMYGQHRLRDDYSFDELRDTIASTTLLTAATGLPGTVKSSAQGAAIKQELGSEGISALAKTAIDFEDPDVARQAKAMNERIESGNELTNTQVYDLQVAMQEQAKVDTQREKAARSMAGRAIENENLVTPYAVDRNGNIQLDEVTGKAYSESAKKAEGIIKSIKSESKESLTDTQVQDGSRAIAGFQTGVFTVNDANTLNYSNTAVRAAFQAATGINLDQYIVKNRDGSVNIPATNTATKDALFAMAADNLVKSAQAETVNWMDNTKGQVVSQISARMGAEGSAVLQQALDGVDERNRSAYMMTANATDMLYQAARNMGTEWSDVKAEAMKMFPGIDPKKLEAMYQAGLDDRRIANDPLRGRQVNIGESVTQIGEQETATGNIFIDTKEPPKGTVIRTFSEIAKNLGADIHLTDEIQNVDGTVIDGANGAYDPKTNTFYLNVSTGIEKNVGYIFMHEVTHYLKANAPEQYLALENLVRERWFQFNPSQMQDAIARKIAAYEKATNGKQVLTEEEALEEIIADAAHEFLNDPNFAQQVAEEDPSLSKAILNSIRNALRMLRQIFGSGTIDDETHMNCLFSEIGILDEAERLWLEAYKQAVRNQAAASYEALQDDCIKLDVEEQEYHTDEQRKIIREYNAAADPNLMQMFEDIRNGKYVKPVEVGTVSPEMAADILDNLPEGVYKEGFDPTGYKIVVSPNYYAHVEKRHGKNGTADQTMADDEDKARIGYVINNYDEILPGGRSREYTMQDIDGENINSPAVGFEKTINGTVIGGLAVPDTKAKTLGITSAYINKKKAFQTPDAYAPGQTAKTVSDNPSNEIISPIGDNSNIISYSTDAYSGQVNMRSEFKSGDDTLGYVDWSIYDDKPNISYIEVGEGWRRRGIATKLLQDIQRQYPDTEINFGMTTEDGTALVDSITYDVVDNEVEAKQADLEQKRQEMSELEARINDESTSDEEAAALGDRWEELDAEVRSLEEEVGDKKAVKKYVRFSVTPQDNEGKSLSEDQQAFFRYVAPELKDEDGNLKRYYHGTGRADRVGYYFDPERATSGPMAYFTDNSEIAENYSKSKQDTSLAYESEDVDDYYNQFVVDVDGEEVRLVDYWHYLTPAQKQEFSKKAGEVTWNDDVSDFVIEEGNTTGNGGYGADPYTVRQARGNAFRMLEDAWLWSGDLFNDEHRFLEILNMIGVENARYKDPNYREEKVYEVYLNVTNPLVTSDIDEEFVDDVKDWVDATDLDYYAKESADADMWDKNSVDPYDWIERLEADVENDTTHAWTSIPDVISDFLKEQGYDGIVDKGGKGGGIGHQVVIPFSSEQIKDINNEHPTKENPDIRYSITPEMDNEYMAAVEAGDMEKAQEMVDEAAQKVGFIPAHRYHGSMNATFTVFDKGYAKVGGNSGAGFYFSTEEEDSANHYADVEGADNYFKWSSLAEHIWDQINDGTWEGEDLETYEDVEEYAKNELNKEPGTYDVYLSYKEPYIRDYKNSTNIYDKIMDDFDESIIDREDYDDEDDYYDALYDERSNHLYEAIYEAVYNANSDLEDNYEVEYGPMVGDIVDTIAEHAYSYESITWSDIQDALYKLGETMVTNEGWTEDADATPEFTRAIVENFGFDAIEDKEVASKFGQLSREMMSDTEHIIVFQPEQIKLSDPVTYAEDGSVIPLSERFNPNNNDIRYSLPTMDADGNILSDGQMEYFKSSVARNELGQLIPMYHVTRTAGFTVFDPTLAFDDTAISFSNDMDFALNYSSEDGNIEDWRTAYENRYGMEEIESDLDNEVIGHYEVYLDMQNPLIVTEDMLEDRDIYEWPVYAKAIGYDGIIHRDFEGLGADIYQVFSSSQIKDTRNLNPTENPDIRYSIIDEDDVLSNLASQDAIDNSREALEYYERLYEMRAPEVEMYFNTPQDEEQISEFYAALNADENVPFEDPVLEEGRVRIAKSKRDFFNNVNAKWRETWTTGGEVLDLKSVEKEIRNLVKSAMANSDTDAKYRQDTVNRTLIDVREAYQLMKQDRTDIASALLYRSAQNMIGNLEFIQDDGTFEEYKAIRSYLRSTKITLDDRFWNEETFREFRKSHFGTLRLAKGLKSDVDKIYQELEEQFPGEFSEAERERLGFGDSEEDLLEHIGYVVDQNVKPFMVAYSSEEAAELASNIAGQLYDIMELGRPIESLGDQLDNKGRRRLEGVYQDMENAEARYLNELESTRSEYDERINRMREDHRSDLDMLDYQTKMMKVRHEEALQKLAERKDKQAERKIAKLKEKQREKEQKRKERQEHKSKFDRIKDNYDWLTQRVLDPTKDKNVPEEFRKSLAEFLQTLDLQTERSKRLEERTGHVAQKTFKMRELKDRLNALAQSKGEDGSSIFEIDANVAYILDALTEKLEKNGNTIDALDEHDISEIDILMKAIRHNLTRVNQIRIEDKRVEIATIGGEVIEDQLKRVQKHGAAKTKGALDVINESALTPAYFFGRLGDGMNSMYEELRYKGFDSYIRNEKLITDRLAGILGKYYKNGGLLRKNRPKPGSMIEEWRDDRSAHTIELTNGSVTMTVAQMMSLYCLSQREQAMTHMLRGGIHVTPIQTGSKVQAAKDKVKGKVESSESVVLNEADIQKIISELTPEQIKVAQELQQLMAVDMAKLGNEAHREMYGYEIFNDPNYFPIKVRGNEIATDVNNIGDVIEKIKSFGPSKPLTPNASNIIEVDDIFSVTADHCNGMNLYNAYLVPISDFMRVYNYKQMMEDGRSLSVKDAIEQAHTKKALTYITNFLKDLNGIKPAQRGGLEDIMNKAIGTAKKTAVFGNIRVALQQPTAIVRALAVMDPKHFVPILKLRPEKGVREEMYKYCPIAQWKSWGYYDTYMGRDIEDVMMNNWSASDVALSGLYGELDNWTWSLIWRAVKSEMHEAHPDMNVKSEEFLQMCGKRASEVFDKTQVVDSTFHRSDAMRSKQVAVKTFTAFMAEPTLTLNVFRAGLYDAREAWLDGNKGKATKIFNRALSVIVLQAAVVSAAQAFADAWRGKDPGLPWDDDDDEDKENGYFVRWLHNYVYNLFDQLHLENNMYLVKDVTPYLNYMISKAADYFDVNPTLRAVMGWDQDYLYSQNNLVFSGLENTANGFAQVFKKLQKGDKYDKDWYDIIQKTSSGVGTFIGFPLGTLMRDTKPIWKAIAASAYAADSTDVTEAKKSRQISGVKDGSTVDNILNHFGINLSDEEQHARDVKKAASERDEKIEKIASKAADLSGEEKDKKIWSEVSTYIKDAEGVNSYKDLIANGDYYSLETYRHMYVQAGGNGDYFDERIKAESKSALKKSIKYDPTEDEIIAQQHIRSYLTANGVPQEELSEMVYKSDTAKDLKVAFRINDEDAMVEALIPMIRAGLTYEDYLKLYENRNRMDLKKYKDSGGRFADRLKSTGTYIWPTQGTITSRFGYRSAPTRGASSYHQAIDIGAAQGTPVVAADGGVVIEARSKSGVGNTVGIKHDDGTITYYNHLYSWNVKVGDTVAQGQEIALVGSTGISTGPHLDFRVYRDGKYLDPETLLQG